MPENSTTSTALTGLVSALAMAALVIGINTNAATAPAAPLKAEAQLMNAKGQPVGTAILTQLPQGVAIRIDAAGLPPGSHAFHIHQTGTCDASTGFKSAGDHFNPTHKNHGSLAAGGAHAGDMPNLTIAADGSLHTELTNSAITLETGPNSLLDPDGSALIIHSAADDYKSQPSGNAGDRIACGIVKPAS